jgi:polyisoprenoid-binding protein YceI
MRALNLKFALAAGLVVVFALPASAGTTTYQIDPRHSSADFGVTHLMISTVRGEFHGVTGTVVVDDANIGNSTVNVTIDATTVDTREPDRDKHLKSDAFFEVANYPAITFKSTKVEKNADGSLKVTGDLTIRGVTKSVVLNSSVPKPTIKDPWGLQRTAVSASTKINRQEFGVSWNQKMDGGGVIVGDDVTITLDVEMIIPPVAK